MPRYVIEACTRFVVDGADSPERALAWFEDLDDIDVDVSPISYGHLQVAGELADDVATGQLQPGTYQAWKTVHVKPLAGRWTPEAWPAKACAGSATGGPTPLRRIAPDPRDPSLEAAQEQPYATERSNGGFHPIQRLVGLLIDIKCEALAAKRADSKQERNAAFDEICSLAQAAANLVEKHAKPAPRLQEVTTRVG